MQSTRAPRSSSTVAASARRTDGGGAAKPAQLGRSNRPNTKVLARDAVGSSASLATASGASGKQLGVSPYPRCAQSSTPTRATARARQEKDSGETAHGAPPVRSRYAFVVREGLLGLRLQSGKDGVAVSAVLENSTAQLNGVGVGDTLLQVNDMIVNGAAGQPDLERITELLRHRPVNLHLARAPRELDPRNRRRLSREAVGAVVRSASRRTSIRPDADCAWELQEATNAGAAAAEGTAAADSSTTCSADSTARRNNEERRDQGRSRRAIKLASSNTPNRHTFRESSTSSSESSSSARSSDMQMGQRDTPKRTAVQSEVQHALAEAMEEQDVKQLKILIPKATVVALDGAEIQSARRLLTFLEARRSVDASTSFASASAAAISALRNASGEETNDDEPAVLRARLAAEEEPGRKCQGGHQELVGERDGIRLKLQKVSEELAREKASRHEAERLRKREQVRADGIEEQLARLQQNAVPPVQAAEAASAGGETSQLVEELRGQRDEMAQRLREADAKLQRLREADAKLRRLESAEAERKAEGSELARQLEVAETELRDLRSDVDERERRRDAYLGAQLQRLDELAARRGNECQDSPAFVVRVAARDAAEGVARVAKSLERLLRSRESNDVHVEDAVVELKAIAECLAKQALPQIVEELHGDAPSVRGNARCDGSPDRQGGVGAGGRDGPIDFSRDDLSFDEVMGSGAVGQVWRGKAKVRGAERPVAIKRYGQESVSDFRSECSCLRRLRHPNVVELVGFLESESECFVVLELLHPPDWQRVDCKTSTRELLTGLSYCHGLEVVHLDVKLDNIMLDPGTGTMKLIDFSVGQSATKLFEGFLGSLPFAAPELCSDMPWEGTPADVFSLGVVLAFLLNVQALFKHVGWAVEMNDGDDDVRREKAPQLQAAIEALAAELESTQGPAGKLCRSLLGVHPLSRPTAAQARSHAWFDEGELR